MKTWNLTYDSPNQTQRKTGLSITGLFDNVDRLVSDKRIPDDATVTVSGLDHELKHPSFYDGTWAIREIRRIGIEGFEDWFGAWTERGK